MPDRTLQDAVINWWYKNRRGDLPWRQQGAGLKSKPSVAPNPYHIWVSEVMSQQTRLDTVKDYYTRWMQRFPTIEALAAATEEEVRTSWAGLGYYRRAMNLKKAAELLLTQTKDSPNPCLQNKEASTINFPRSAQEIEKLPGVGPYTAAAISSICFGEPVCAVDGNVLRVLARLWAERNFDPKLAKNLKRAREWGDELMNTETVGETSSKKKCGDPGALNQGLMELGAGICGPQGEPQCEHCPLRNFCKTFSLVHAQHASIEQGERITKVHGVIPLKGRVADKKNLEATAIVHVLNFVERKPIYLLIRRPSDVILGGMFEPLTIPRASSYHQKATDSNKNAKPPLAKETLLLPDATKREALIFQKLKRHLILDETNEYGTITHIFTHIRLEVHIKGYHWTLPTGKISQKPKPIQSLLKTDVQKVAETVELFSEEDLAQKPLSVLTKKILRKVHRVKKN